MQDMDLITNQQKFYQKLKEIKEFNIGHFIIGESVFHGCLK